MREHTGRPTRTSDFPCSWGGGGGRGKAGGTKVLETQRRAASCPNVVINAGGRDMGGGWRSKLYTAVKPPAGCPLRGETGVRENTEQKTGSSAKRNCRWSRM